MASTNGSVVQRFGFDTTFHGVFETNRQMLDLEKVGNQVWQATDGSIVQVIDANRNIIASIETNRLMRDLEHIPLHM